MSEPKLEEILEEYAAATPAGNDLKILREASEQNPQYADDLTDFAAARAVVRYAPEEELSVDEEAHFAEVGLKNLRTVLGSVKTQTAAEQALKSLIETAKAKGLNKKSFASAAGLSTSLLIYLEKRRLEFASIPRTIVAELARVLETAEESVSAYLSQPPDFAAGASYKTNTRPEEMQPKSFADAVREDQQLSAEEKRKLLDLIEQ